MIYEMKITVHGKVQGVGYRASILRFVDQNYLQVVGYVKNLPNGTVQIVAQGQKAELEKIRQFSTVGSRACKVDHIEEVSHVVSSLSFETFEVGF